MAKLQAYELQDAGLDTVDANHALGFQADCRDFSLPAAICTSLASSEFACSRTTRASLAPWLTPASRLSLGSLRSRADSILPCLPAGQKEKMGHALSLRGKSEDADDSTLGARGSIGPCEPDGNRASTGQIAGSRYRGTTWMKGKRYD